MCNRRPVMKLFSFGLVPLLLAMSVAAGAQPAGVSSSVQGDTARAPAGTENPGANLQPLSVQPSAAPVLPNAPSDSQAPARKPLAESGAPPVEPAPAKPGATEALNANELTELRESVHDTMMFAFQLQREIEELRRRETPSPTDSNSAPATGGQEKATDLDRRLSAMLEDLTQRIAKLERSSPVTAAPPGPAGPVPPAPARDEGPQKTDKPDLRPTPVPGETQPWRIEADGRGKLLLFPKRDAEKWPAPIVSKEDCAVAGAWIDKQSRPLPKDAFFVRDDEGIAVCRRNGENDWRVYSGIAATDRFHIMIKSGG
jgi:hypothetical protein